MSPGVADLILAAIACAVFAAGFACGRLDRSERRSDQFSAEDILRMLREPVDVSSMRAGGFL